MGQDDTMLFGSMVVIIGSSANGGEEIGQAADFGLEEEVLKARAFSILHEDFEGVMVPFLT